ncbi:MAG TPA: hypothetical protein VL131_04795 [Gammaproteobacteria bacterium]|nr:hypothetical protein [Gammaproteobacteria bacterium]
MRSTRRTLIWLSVYALAMAQVEAAVVIYLREIYHGGDPRALFPLVPLAGGDLSIELIRELATVLMIASVALLQPQRGARAIGAFIYVFGLWDIAYYAWLKLLLGWPTRWLEWDVLFLIPWPWLAPWLTPVLVSLLFVVAGARLLSAPARFTRLALSTVCVGAALVVAAFVMPALSSAADRNAGGFRTGDFPWGIFVAGYLLMAVGLAIAGGTTVREQASRTSR